MLSNIWDDTLYETSRLKASSNGNPNLISFSENGFKPAGMNYGYWLLLLQAEFFVATVFLASTAKLLTNLSFSPRCWKNNE